MADEVIEARIHLEKSIALYNADEHRSFAFIYGQDPLMGCQCYASRVLWVLGYPDQALQLSEASVAWAWQLEHPFSLAFALSYAGGHHWLRREWQLVLERAETLIALCVKQEFSQWGAQAMDLKGRALAKLGDKEGLDQIRQGIEGRQKTGARTRPHVFVVLAEALYAGGQAEEGLHVVDQGLAVSEETGERWIEAELYRLKGELLLRLSGEKKAEAESYLHQALDVARFQSAKSWELRAAISLARLWQSQHKREEARALLARVYEWFTEGFDTGDLQEAKALLEELA